MMVSFIDENRDEFGVEPICAQLPIAPSGYYAAKSRPPSARARRDAELIPQLVALWTANYRVYGARKLWKAARRAGIDVGRRGVCVLHRRRVQPADRRLASSGAHAHRHGARRPGDGPRVPRRAPGRPGGAFRRPVEPGQFTSLRWGERLAELGAVPSVGSVGDSYDCDVMVGLPGRV